MKKVRVLTAEEAALLVNDGDTIATGGFVSCACPEALSKALEKRFLETGHPRDLTLFFAAGQGHRDGTGGDHYGHEGMVKRVIGGHWDRAPKLGDLALSNKIEAYNLPQGVISHMYRDIAAHNIGTITHVGLYTFADPRNGGGKLNDVTKEDLVKVVEIEGQERLLYKAFPINVVFLRASYADEYGNCTVHREIGPIDVTAMAQACKNSGGRVIVQVEKIVQGGSLDPKLVAIPGIYVDSIVVGSIEDNEQCLGMPYDGSLTGEFRIPVDAIPPIPLDAKKIIARRAAMELLPHAVTNLGIGMPEGVAAVAAEEGLAGLVLPTEVGPIGGLPAAGNVGVGLCPALAGGGDEAVHPVHGLHVHGLPDGASFRVDSRDGLQDFRRAALSLLREIQRVVVAAHLTAHGAPVNYQRRQPVVGAGRFRVEGVHLNRETPQTVPVALPDGFLLGDVFFQIRILTPDDARDHVAHAVVVAGFLVLIPWRVFPCLC